MGSAWFSGDEHVKGTIAPGRHADFAILSADYLAVPDEQIRTIESVLTVTGGDIVHASGSFADVAPAALPPVSPAWSPVAGFSGPSTPLLSAPLHRSCGHRVHAPTNDSQALTGLPCRR